MVIELHDTTSTEGCAGTGAIARAEESASDGEPLTEREAERLVGAICFKTGPPGTIGAELEWLVSDARDPSLPVPFDKIRGILSALERPGALPGAGLLTLEPGGQVELSTAPASLSDCVAAASGDLDILREAFGSEGLVLAGSGIDPVRRPRRVLDLPRYAAMERHFDRRGHWGRLMMCSTASVQVCVNAGLECDGRAGYPFRWRLAHALGPILVGSFANSPVRRGRPTGWKCTRQLVWSRLDPGRTSAPPGAQPCPGPRQRDAELIRSGYAGYALNAEVLCVRRADGESWTVPAGLPFRDWLSGRGRPCSDGPSGVSRAPTADDLTYHLSTLFPPVRPRGHLELRMIDAQPGDGWIVPVAVVAALADDEKAADAAMAAAEPVWGGAAPGRSGRPHPAGPWLRAARAGLADPVLAKAASDCFDAAAGALARAGAPAVITDAVAGFTERYVTRGRCPADDILDTVPTTLGGSR